MATRHGRMPSSRLRRVTLVTTIAILFAGSILMVAPGHAANCPPATVGGPVIGTITASGVSVPIKPVTFQPGGILRPPATNQAAGVSTLNAPLNATEGTTVMAWHVRYGKGCPGTLNPLLDLPIGATFTITEPGSQPIEYRITRRFEVPQGKYRKEWFTPIGPRRIALFTCGDLRYERFHSTIATFAKPTAASCRLASGVNGHVEVPGFGQVKVPGRRGGSGCARGGSGSGFGLSHAV